MIIYLTKVRLAGIMVLHEPEPHFFLGFAAEAVARNCLRRSFFMLARSFRVGTF
jgi:hypothetical protein